MTDPLEHLARRVEGDPFFLASALAHYARSQRLDDQGLAATLGCSLQELTALRLCRLPAAAPPAFGRDIDRIAARFGINADILAEVVKRGQALQCWRQGGGAAPGTLLAARAKPRPPQDAPSPEGGAP